MRGITFTLKMDHRKMINTGDREKKINKHRVKLEKVNKGQTRPFLKRKRRKGRKKHEHSFV